MAALIVLMYNLFLDDVRIPSKVTWVELPLVEWTIARNYDQFVAMITAQGLPTRIAFDHDLAAEHYDQAIKQSLIDGKEIDYDSFQDKTGMDCVKWLVEYCIAHNAAFPEYYLHTMNPVGAQNMKSYIESYEHSRTKT